MSVAEQSITDGVREILAAHPGATRDSLIPILQEIQEKQGFLSREAVVEVGRHLQLPTSKIYGVATFYNQFRFNPQGKYHIQVCRGTACHVKGSAAILDALKRELKINSGETTRDGLFSLEVVACIGACGLAPVINVDGNFHANLTTQAIPKVLDIYRKRVEESSN
jgi:NADH-quinone oxidoreductase subunit E